MARTAERAAKLHERGLVLDAHYDLLPLVLDKRRKGRNRVVEEDYLPAFRAGRVDGVVSSLFVSDDHLPEMGLRRTLDMIAALHAEMEESPGLFALCRSVADIDAARERGELAILLSLEGVDAIGNDLALLRILYELGVRGVGLVWSRRNYAGDGCFFASVREGRKGGLTDFGVRVVEEAVRLGMYLDVSHLNDEGLEDLLSFTDVPLMASHSNCRVLAPSMRNLTDGQIVRLAERGGVLGMNSCSTFVREDPKKDPAGPGELADHALHIKDLVGAEHVMLGFDFCDEMRGPSDLAEGRYYDCVRGYGESAAFTAALLERGFTDDEAAGVLGGNLLDFLRRTIG